MILEKLFIISCCIVSATTSFRCYVCNSLEDPSCENNPRLVAVCPYLATEAVLQKEYGKKENGVINFDISIITVRRCSNVYSRYKYQAGCQDIYMALKTENTEVCYCESSLCNFSCCEKFSLILLLFIMPTML
ncbi:uncharacterized protein LOC126321701 isoform X2 [Schistocerca gregaria]|uniref:uncharacterized protein LOC126321701 isoform X2 n=1 Tax=Schistocerca gregaria TaxID=7010 RepID=UPI00211F1F28|nr:uncharacterized protein LOC126321701 isoform X2 [Schistocerca gregaria]